MANYWEAQTGGFNRGLGNLGSALVQIPRLRLMQQYRQQMADTARAREEAYADEARSVSELNRTKTGGLLLDQAGDSKLADALTRYAKNPQDTDAQADVISGFGRAYKKNPEGTAKSLGDLFAQFAARNGSTNVTQMGELQGGAASIANNQATNAERAGRPMALPTGSRLVAPDGSVLQNALSVMPKGADYQTETTEIPPVPGRAEIPAHDEGGFMGIGATHVPASPAVPEQPKKTITRRVKIASDDAGTNQPALAAALMQGAPAPAPMAPGNVPSPSPVPGAAAKVLTPDIAAQYLAAAAKIGKTRADAEKQARADGYTW